MKKRGRARQEVGIVISNKMNKTVIVMVERIVKHKMYHKYVRRQTKFAAHDEDNKCKTGDKVRITESRPISKTKKWRISEIIVKIAV